MILVTLGTHPQPMDRLISALDALVEAGRLTEEVQVQAAAFHLKPRRLATLPVLPHDELLQLIRISDVVISHGGPGTLALIRGEGKVPVVVPRSPLFGEHVDDHQVRYARNLATVPGYIVVDDLRRLADAIDQARGSHSAPVMPDVSRAVDALRALLPR